jgi:hypothetical protein
LLDSFFLHYMGWVKPKNHLTLLSLSEIHTETPFWELSRLCPETSTKLYVYEFGFRFLSGRIHTVHTVLYLLTFLCYINLTPYKISTKIRLIRTIMPLTFLLIQLGKLGRVIPVISEHLFHKDPHFSILCFKLYMYRQ